MPKGFGFRSLNFFPSELHEICLNKQIAVASKLHWSIPEMDKIDLMEFEKVWEQVKRALEEEKRASEKSNRQVINR